MSCESFQMSQEPIVIDADKFIRPYLNRITVDAVDKCSAVGSRTGFEEDGLLVKLEDPCCKRFNKDGKFTVFISLETVERLYYTVHPPTSPVSATSEVEDESEEIPFSEFSGLVLSDANIINVEDVTLVEWPNRAPKFEDPGFVVIQNIGNCSQKFFISNVLLDRLTRLRKDLS